MLWYLLDQNVEFVMRYENSGWLQKDNDAYLLRMCREDNVDGMPSVTERLRRASLQSPDNNQQIDFTRLVELFDVWLFQADHPTFAQRVNLF